MGKILVESIPKLNSHIQYTKMTDLFPLFGLTFGGQPGAPTIIYIKIFMETKIEMRKYTDDLQYFAENSV